MLDSSSQMLINSLAANDTRTLAVLRSLASGHINSAAREPADIISGEALRSELAAIDSQMQAAQRADSVAAVAEGALSEVSASLTRAHSLAVASANTAAMSEAEIKANQMEMQAIASSVDYIVSSSRFAGRSVFDGQLTLSVGGASLTMPSLSAATIGAVDSENSLASLMGTDAVFNPRTPVDIINAASEQISTLRGEIGSFRHSVVASMSNSLEDMFTSTSSSLSVIVDTDYASSMAELTRGRILYSSQIKALGLTMDMSLSTRELINQLLD